MGYRSIQSRYAVEYFVYTLFTGDQEMALTENQEMVQHWISSLTLPFFTFVGAFILYMLNRLQNKQPFSFFRVINIDVGVNASPLAVLSDMVISSFLGILVVIPLTSPSTVAQAIIAGLGMTGLLATYSKDT